MGPENTRAYEKRIKVLYILGFARCGSTLLGNLLGEIDGFIHVGELDRFWKRASLPERKCGCGLALVECSVWSTVLTRVQECFPDAGGSCTVGREDYHKQWFQWVKDQRASAIKKGGLWSLRSPGIRPAKVYSQIVEETLNQIATLFSPNVIVDGSKDPAAGALLKDMPSVQPYFLHLVRDPRGAVLSRQKKKAGKVQGKFNLKIRGTVLDSLRWFQNNKAAEARENLGADRYLRLSYESLILDPHGTLSRIIDFLDETTTDLPLLDNTTAKLSKNHTIGGNPNRFKSGEISLRIDNEWVTNMKRRDFIAITALTAPLLRRYDYSLKRDIYPPLKVSSA